MPPVLALGQGEAGWAPSAASTSHCCTPLRVLGPIMRSGTLAACCDSLGRVTLVDTAGTLVLRMLKGYRDAQVGGGGVWAGKWVGGWWVGGRVGGPTPKSLSALTLSGR